LVNKNSESRAQSSLLEIAETHPILRICAKIWFFILNLCQTGLSYKNMLQITKRLVFLGVILTIVSSVLGCAGDVKYETLEGFTQGTTYRITYSNNVPEIGVGDMVEDVLKKVDFSMSGYNPESTLSKVNRGEDVVVEQIFIDVFNRAKEMYEITGGYFDVSAAPLFDIWGFGFTDRSSVTQDMIDSVKQYIGMDRVNIAAGRVIKSDPGIKLNFNAIAQGYTSDLIAMAFDSVGIKNYLVEVGGEIFCKGVKASGDKWNIGIDLPEEGNFIQGAELAGIIKLSGRGLATSGNYRKFYEENGQKYSHTIDPLTGYPARHSLLSATVVAGDAMTADAYGTYLMIIGLDRAIEVVEATPGVDAYLIYWEDEEYKIYRSAGVEVLESR
jgi:Membrane-associated lipoprotein involved in thiamine biosynthesis